MRGFSLSFHILSIAAILKPAEAVMWVPKESTIMLTLLHSPLLLFIHPTKCTYLAFILSQAMCRALGTRQDAIRKHDMVLIFKKLLFYEET